MRKHTPKGLLLLLAFVIVLTACGQNKKTMGSGTDTGVAATATTTTTAQPSPVPSAAPSPAKAIQVQAFYADRDGTQLVPKEASISYPSDGDGSKYLAALNLLKESKDNTLVALCSGFTFGVPTIKDGSLTVDLSFKQDNQFGAPGEELVLHAIEKTLFQFDEVKSIDITVNGKKAESLMGHVELPHPINR
jgi:spore germination protein GerM